MQEDCYKSKASLGLHGEFQASQNRTLPQHPHMPKILSKYIKTGIYTTLEKSFPFPTNEPWTLCTPGKYSTNQTRVHL